MSTSDSLDDEELAADLRKRTAPAGKAVSAQVVHLTSTLKVSMNQQHSNMSVT